MRDTTRRKSPDERVMQPTFLKLHNYNIAPPSRTRGDNHKQTPLADATKITTDTTHAHPNPNTPAPNTPPNPDPLKLHSLKCRRSQNHCPGHRPPGLVAGGERRGNHSNQKTTRAIHLGNPHRIRQSPRPTTDFNRILPTLTHPRHSAHHSSHCGHM